MARHRGSDDSGGNGTPRRPISPARAAPDLAFDPIEAALQQLHHSMVDEDIPRDFLDLLDRLDDLPANAAPPDPFGASDSGKGKASTDKPGSGKSGSGKSGTGTFGASQ